MLYIIRLEHVILRIERLTLSKVIKLKSIQSRPVVQRFSPWKPPLAYLSRVEERNERSISANKLRTKIWARETHLNWSERPLESFPYIWLPIRLAYGAEDVSRRRKSTNALKVFSCALLSCLMLYLLESIHQIKILFFLERRRATGSVRSLNSIRMDG